MVWFNEKVVISGESLFINICDWFGWINEDN